MVSYLLSLGSFVLVQREMDFCLISIYCKWVTFNSLF